MDGGDAGDTDKGMVEAVDGKQGAAELPAGSVRIFRAGGGRRLSGAQRSGRFMSAAQRVTGCI